MSQFPYSAFFHNSQDLLAILRLNGEIVKLNRAWKNRLSLDPASLEGSSLLKWIHEEDLDRTLTLLGRLKKGKPVASLLNRVHTEQSEYREVEWSMQPEGDFILATAREVNRVQRKEKKEKHFEQEYFRQITENMGEVFWLRDAGNDQMIYISPAYETIWGRSVASLYENPMNFLRSIHNEDRERVIQEYEEYKKSERLISEYRIVRPDGGIRWVQAKSFPVKNDKGKIIRHTGIAVDITERKQAEEELLKAKSEAEKANQTKAQFLANLSHEIRTPLNGVLGFAELLEKTELDSLQKQYVDNTITSANTLLSIINDILTYSKINSGEINIEKDSTDIREMIESTLNVIRDLAHEKELELLLNIEANVPKYVEIDPVRVRQILINMLNNAIKFTPKGEVELKVCFTAISRKYGRLHLSVRDTGVGISETDKEKIFKAFSQADNSNTRKFGGAGLGLIISNLLARGMGSEIVFESELGSGSLFTLSLDTRYEGSVAITHCSQIRQVMVIDDNAASRIILENMLLERELECSLFNHGSAALGHLQNFDGYDMVFVDYDMPGMNGVEVVKKIRAVGHRLETPVTVVVMHSNDDSQIHELFSGLSVSHYLHKPVFDHKLDRVLREINEKRSKQEELTDRDDFTASKPSDTDVAESVILIAEDNKMNMMLNKILVQKLLPGCRILEAENGREAVDLLEMEHVDVVLMDIQMPEMDGLEATRAIRMQEKYTGEHLPIIAVTAGALQEEKEKCFDAGMDEFMTKPVDAQLLHSLLIKHLPRTEVVAM
ncbi:MAG: hybrid sensor histidine kinase/response regulator [Balneolaceae bacterium]|nr:MAG: hybrid sensor histidine kinase/response regulator [Balneolaceae bacterium]